MTRYAIETIAASATAPGASPGAAMAAVTGDSLRIRDALKAGLIDNAQLIQGASGGTVRITSPLLHDNTVGINQRSSVNNKAYNQYGYMQPLTPQDTLTLNAVGSATAGDVELAALTIMYEDLAGIDANLITFADLQSRFIEFFGPRFSIAGTAAGWTGSTLLTASDDQWKANEEYAWLGISVDASFANVLMVGLTSPDWGNLRLACPIDVLNHHNITSYWPRVARNMGKPCIPVLNASQKSNINYTILQNENNTTVTGVMLAARLRPKARR